MTDIVYSVSVSKDVTVAASDPPYTKKSCIVHVNCNVDVFLYDR